MNYTKYHEKLILHINHNSIDKSGGLGGKYIQSLMQSHKQKITLDQVNVESGKKEENHHLKRIQSNDQEDDHRYNKLTSGTFWQMFLVHNGYFQLMVLIGLFFWQCKNSHSLGILCYQSRIVLSIEYSTWHDISVAKSQLTQFLQIPKCRKPFCPLFTPCFSITS